MLRSRLTIEAATGDFGKPPAHSMRTAECFLHGHFLKDRKPASNINWFFTAFCFWILLPPWESKAGWWSYPSSHSSRHMRQWFWFCSCRMLSICPIQQHSSTSTGTETLIIAQTGIHSIRCFLMQPDVYSAFIIALQPEFLCPIKY